MLVKFGMEGVINNRNITDQKNQHSLRTKPRNANTRNILNLSDR